jgi:hypothetical protein
LRVAGVAGLQDLDRDGGAVGFAAHERPGEPSLAEKPFEGVGAERLADEVGGGIQEELLSSYRLIVSNTLYKRGEAR